MLFWFGKNKVPIMGEKILIISDIHFELSPTEYDILKQKFTQVWLLGDIPRYVLELVDKINCVKLGVLGNHDSNVLFDNLSILNMHKQSTKVNNLTIAGIEGSSKYKKNSKNVMLTQEDSREVAKKLPIADVLLSHDSMYHKHSEELNKEGLQGITDFIQEKHPILHVYGHHHEFCIYKHQKTLCICNYRLGVIEPNGEYHQC